MLEAGPGHQAGPGLPPVEEELRLLRAENLVDPQFEPGTADRARTAVINYMRIHHEDYATREEARASIFEYIEVFYNRIRRHSYLGYQSPSEFERTGSPFTPRSPFLGKSFGRMNH